MAIVIAQPNKSDSLDSSTSAPCNPNEWAALIYAWAVSNGLLNTPCTLYEIAHGDDTVQESFYGLEKDVLVKALRSLELQRRAQLMNIGTESEGVKFLQ
ncbi:hypothetical protein COOONC_27417 [Cooperia oncophora]